MRLELLLQMDRLLTLSILMIIAMPVLCMRQPWFSRLSWPLRKSAVQAGPIFCLGSLQD